ncbi:Gfo/Idh/MocA family protein [Fodinicola feengrottensis]|uniref:Gfo/Idh/MocA family protein n=1 Tax=Fodinicola feengrottensis TaxID=435914 RepID=UPI0013D382A8|nr:Gfo/Idh/MocA family oxidoreductase [Fodinicola feengrottensis]
MTDIRVGLVGLDHWYSAIPLAEGIGGRDGVRLVGIADAEPARASELATRCGVDLVDKDWRALVEDPTVDAIISLVSPDRNAEVCRTAAEAGKHIISNKPLARTVAEATMVVAAVRRAGVRFLPAESRMRLGPRSQFLKRWIEQGRLGRLLSASLSIWAGLPRRWPDDPDPGWFVDPGRTAGGGWIDHAVYQVDMLRWLLGEEIVAVTGQTANLAYPELAVEDYGVATVTFAGGAVATLEDTWTAPGAGFQSSGTYVGSDGVYRMDGISDRSLILADFPPLQGWVQTALPGHHDQAADIDHWTASIRDEVEPVATVEDAWHNLASCLAFYESVRTGRTIEPEVAPCGSRAAAAAGHSGCRHDRDRQRRRAAEPGPDLGQGDAGGDRRSGAGASTVGG